MIDPIDDGQQAEVVRHTSDWVRHAGAYFERDFTVPEVRFDLSGGSSGMFRVSGRHCLIRYNPWLFAKYWDENLQGTVPHEVAHYIVHQVYGRRVRPHGLEWQALMTVFGADPAVTNDFDLSGIPRRQERRFAYHCGCREHAVSTRRHNLMRKGRARYQCLKCGGELVAAG